MMNFHIHHHFCQYDHYKSNCIIYLDKLPWKSVASSLKIGQVIAILIGIIDHHHYHHQKIQNVNYTLVHPSTLWYTWVHLSTLWYYLVHPSTLCYILMHPSTHYYTFVQPSTTYVSNGYIWN